MPEPVTEEEWLECIPLPQYLARIPAGHIITIAGEEIWIDGNGDQLSTERYKARYPGTDPAVVWAAKKRYLRERGGGVHKAD